MSRPDIALDTTARIGELFARENVDRTVAALVGSQGEVGSGGRETIKARLTEAEAKLRRLQAAIEAGVEPAALVESINVAQGLSLAFNLVEPMDDPVDRG